VASPLRWRRPLGRPALALAAALAAVGCASATAGTSGNSAAAPTRTVASITTAQASQVFNSYVATTAKAIRTSDGALALSVVTGALRSTLSAELKGHGVHVYSAVHSTGSGAYKSTLTLNLGQPLGPYTYGGPTFYLPESAGYPRFFVANDTRTLKDISPALGLSTWVGGTSVPLDGRVLMLFEQSAPSRPWLLASTSELPAGTAVPPLATDKNGDIPQVPLTSAGLLAQPYATGPLQAAVVDDGPASAAAKAVAAGPLTTAMYQAYRDRTGTGADLQVPSGDIYQWDMEGTAYPAFALRTADGGALVLYAMYLNSTVATPGYINKADPIESGSPIEVPQNLSPLLPTGQPTPRTVLEAQDLFSFAAIDPPAGSSKVQVIAIGGGLNYATAS
jgi:hypothetical protein